jgi:hypothetical protein
MITLVFFRKSQRDIEIEVDNLYNSPADYTVCVRNIPVI